jgi:hypothetical protein
MLQVALGQTEVILQSIAFEVDQEFWSFKFVWSNQPVGKKIFYLELFFSFHQLGWERLMGGLHLRG